MNRVTVVGLGYVGLTLAVAFARKGLSVFGCDREPGVVTALQNRRPHLYEPGVEEGLRERLGRGLHVATELPCEPVDAAVLCVSTPVHPETREPRLENLRAAAKSVAEACSSDTLVVVRSTVPVGATRRVVLPELLARWGRARLAFCP
ncbi:MAG: UDP-glucose/GDP-mannose dehydrogenase, partial [bacterium]